MTASEHPIVVEPAQAATGCVVWLHGLGADGHDFEPVVPHLGRISQCTRFVFPHAPMQPVTINGGMVMRAWYDITGMDIERGTDLEGIQASQATACQLIEQQVTAGIPAGRIVLAGFSQGGAIALHTGIRYGAKLAGIMGLSTYLPRADLAETQAHAANRTTPILLSHGTRDPVVPIDLAKSSREHLCQLGYAAKWYTYDLDHSVSPEELADIGAWLEQVLP
ncbi:MAG: alpha/beta hydrolase fold domain-containing protein [Gammaproteobacteria bacterium]|nr:alpha/beta hydrolase fold domain-containing protein [Gammaproteobacteria bacterium]